MEDDDGNKCCEKGDSPSRNGPLTLCNKCRHSPIENPRTVMNTNGKTCLSADKKEAASCAEAQRVRDVMRSGTKGAVASIDNKKSEANVTNFKYANEKMETPEKGQVAESLRKEQETFSTSIPPLEPAFYSGVSPAYKNHTQQRISNDVTTQAQNQHWNEVANYMYIYT